MTQASEHVRRGEGGDNGDEGTTQQRWAARLLPKTTESARKHQEPSKTMKSVLDRGVPSKTKASALDHRETSKTTASALERRETSKTTE